MYLKVLCFTHMRDMNLCFERYAYFHDYCIFTNKQIYNGLENGSFICKLL